MPQSSTGLKCPFCGVALEPPAGQKVMHCPNCHAAVEVPPAVAGTSLLDRLDDVVDDIASGNPREIAFDLLGQGDEPARGGLGALQKPMESLENLDDSLHVVDAVAKKVKKREAASVDGIAPGKPAEPAPGPSRPGALAKAQQSGESMANLMHILDGGFAQYRKQARQIDRAAPTWEKFLQLISLIAALLILLGTCLYIVISTASMFHGMFNH
ncbi:MAG TPA: hypothetical protein VMT91_11275 [Anaerolineales bacterium]|nr:hypothetical protein [Anaerolineales bacterium]